MGKVNKNIVKTIKTNKRSSSGDKITLLQSPKEAGRPKAKTIISKKEKFKQKHKKLLSKFAALKKARKVENARRNREKTAIIGDLQPLKDALPSLDELVAISKEIPSEQKKKLSIKEKIRQKRNKFIEQTKSFEALLRDPEYKKNPRAQIALHIKRTHCLN